MLRVKDNCYFQKKLRFSHIIYGFPFLKNMNLKFFKQNEKNTYAIMDIKYMFHYIYILLLRIQRKFYQWLEFLRLEINKK